MCDKCEKQFSIKVKQLYYIERDNAKTVFLRYRKEINRYAGHPSAGTLYEPPPGGRVRRRE